MREWHLLLVYFFSNPSMRLLPLALCTLAAASNVEVSVLSSESKLSQENSFRVVTQVSPWVFFSLIFVP